MFFKESYLSLGLKQESLYFDIEKLYTPPAVVAEVGGWDLGRGDANTHHVPVALLSGHNFDIIIINRLISNPIGHRQ